MGRVGKTTLAKGLWLWMSSARSYLIRGQLTNERRTVEAEMNGFSRIVFKVRDMGRQIVQNQSIVDYGLCSRLFDRHEILGVSRIRRLLL
ncbi:hypothetical protein PIB30_073676 [Stylosanthes scabra]|uniref:Uncharacterized protein n=1 Tax=Stylosanthes scabra TaxID=79078 RepID=A0ABU6RPC5_9FABA|nr:hypothetical protein [Stylosanthes scabra]